MEKIKVEEWGGREFYFNPAEVREAADDAEVIECLMEWNGVKPYGPVRCRALAERPEGKKLAREIRRICEGGGNKKKVQRKVRNPKVDAD